MRVLITGASGFVGPHLQRAFTAAGHEALGDAQRGARCDLGAEGVADEIIRSTEPEAIVHLAARTDIRADPWRELIHNNQLACFRVLDAIHRHVPRSHAVIASSSAVYGAVPRERNPIRETETPHPVTMYGASKLGSEAIAFAFAARGMHVTVCRPFNTVGPGGDRRSALAQWTRKLVALDRGAGTLTFHCGPLNTSRDLTDVRDIARAYVSIVEQRVRERVVNVCSGRAVEGSTLLGMLTAAADMRLEVVSEAQRPDDIVYQSGDHTRLTSTTGWQPVITLEQTIADVLQEHRQEAAA